MNINKDGLSFGVAYVGCYLAYNGVEPNKSGLIDGAAQMTAAERETIISGILELIEMTEEDVDGDGVVDESDAEEIFEAAHDQYGIDSRTEVERDGEAYTKNIIFEVEFHGNLKRKGVDNSVKEWMIGFYESVCNASSEGGSVLEDHEEKVLGSIRKLLFD